MMIWQPFNSEFEVKILEKIFQNPILRTEIQNKWNVSTTQEIHMTNDKEWFSPKETKLRLWMGENMGRYSISSPTLWIESDCPSLKTEHHAYYRLVWRYVRAHHNIRRLVFTIIPPGGAIGNSLCYFEPMKDCKLLLFLCGMLNSYILEYRVRHTAQGPAITQYIIKELPLPRLSEDNLLRKEIEKRVFALVRDIFKDHKSFQVSFEDMEYPKQMVNRNIFEAEIDALVAIAYDFSREMYQRLLSIIPLPRGLEQQRLEQEKRDLALQKYEELKGTIFSEISEKR